MTRHSSAKFLKWLLVAAVYIGFLFGVIAMSVAHAHEKRAEVLINEWCWDFEVIDRFARMAVQDEIHDARNLIGRAIVDSLCEKMPPGLSILFTPAEIVKEYSYVSGKNWGVLVRGHVIKKNGEKGKQAFTLVPIESMDRFRPAAKSNGIKYQEA